MRIGVDLDGVLTRPGWFSGERKFPWWFFLVLIFVRPDKRMAEILRKLEGQGDISIVSARPKQLEGLTRAWLRFHKIPFSNLFCVGLGKGVGQRKLEVISQTGVEEFFDNDERIVNFLRENFINAHLAGALFR